MRAAIVFVLAMLSAVATPAAAEWTFIGENTGGDQFFIDLSTLKKGARPRAWFLTNYPTRTKQGVLSSKILREADCREEKIRILAARFYSTPMGMGDLMGSSDEATEWTYATPNTMEEEYARTMCRGNR
jgi:hypothetical protein